jgi:cell division protein ZapB
MDLELSELEEKISQLVDAVQQLRSENRLLRQQIAARTDEIKRLSEKIDVAKGRLQAVLEQIPEEAA